MYSIAWLFYQNRFPFLLKICASWSCENVTLLTEVTQGVSCSKYWRVYNCALSIIGMVFEFHVRFISSYKIIVIKTCFEVSIRSTACRIPIWTWRVLFRIVGLYISLIALIEGYLSYISSVFDILHISLVPSRFFAIDMIVFFSVFTIHSN